jgi:hypothetical protein
MVPSFPIRAGRDPPRYLIRDRDSRYGNGRRVDRLRRPSPTQQAGSLVGRCLGACTMYISMQPDGRMELLRSTPGRLGDHRKQPVDARAPSAASSLRGASSRPWASLRSSSRRATRASSRAIASRSSSGDGDVAGPLLVHSWNDGDDTRAALLRCQWSSTAAIDLAELLPRDRSPSSKSSRTVPGLT